MGRRVHARYAEREEWEGRHSRPPTRRHRSANRAGIGEAALKGALAGMVGGVVMMMAVKLENKALLPEGERMEPPPKQVVETLSERAGADLSDRQAMAGGTVAHMGYSAFWGAIYGAAQSRLHAPDLLHGLLFGGLVYAANFPEFALLPKLDILPPPSAQPPRKAAVPVGAHLVFGLATAKTFDVLT